MFTNQSRLGREDVSPTVKPTEKFNAAEDAKALRKAIKGWGKARI